MHERDESVAMTRLPPLSGLRAFDAAARRMSFKLAADDLHVTPTAVSHQIRQLECALGVALFERGTRQVRLTDAGQRLQAPVREGFAAFARGIEAVSQPSRVATLSSTVAFTARRLALRAGTFADAHPGWQLRLDATNRVVDLQADADAALRYGATPQPGLVVEPLLHDRFAPVCTPTLAAAAVDALHSVPLIAFDWGPAFRDDARAPVWRHWFERVGQAQAAPALMVSEELHAVQATLAGQGVGLLSLELVADELASGALVRPFRGALDGLRYDLVFHREAADRAATRMLRAWVLDVFSPQRRVVAAADAP